MAGLAFTIIRIISDSYIQGYMAVHVHTKKWFKFIVNFKKILNSAVEKNLINMKIPLFPSLERIYMCNII